MTHLIWYIQRLTVKPLLALFIKDGLTSQLNKFLCSDKTNGNLPTGVSFHKKTGKYSAEIRIDTKKVSLKYHDTPEKAHHAWLTAKRNHALLLSKEQKDERIEKALLRHYY